MKREQHVWSTIGLSAAHLVVGAGHPESMLVAAGVLAGVLLHPDLDQGRTPYGMVRKHRGLSHWPVVGTLDRLLWFAGPALALWLAAGRAVDWDGLMWVAVGLALADLLHVALDALETEAKRWFKFS